MGEDPCAVRITRFPAGSRQANVLRHAAGRFQGPTVGCGTLINPDVVRMQVESAIVFALLRALYGEIILRDGAVEHGSFDAYPVLHTNECPEIEVHPLASDANLALA